MCGIYGMVGFGEVLRQPERLAVMGAQLRHRGPDDSGRRAEPRVAFGVERLRITDLRPEAAQPFSDPAGRVWVSGNGAVYNSAAIRRRYADYPYRSRSDIEPLVPLYLDRGLAAFTELDGMFALAIWDGRTGELVLARDRAGEKPLFWRTVGRETWFASEIQALLTDDAPARLDTFALVDYVHLGYPREPRTMLEAVHKVPAGTALVFTGLHPTVHRYWCPETIAPAGIDVATATHELDRLLVAAVERQIVADVPVGVFTSGGVDSALLATLAARRLDRLETFTVGFRDPSYDERGPAAQLAAALRSEHVAVAVGDEDLLEAFDVVTSGIAEPIADPAILPTYLLARTARQHVGVVLSGEGADELFGGYPTYLGHRLARAYRLLPGPLRRLVRGLVGTLPVSHAKVTVEFLLRRFVAHADDGLFERHVAWFGSGLPDRALAADRRAPLRLEPGVAGDALRQVMLFDYRTYLPDNLLAKIDRATMLVGLESRAPFLDREVSSFALGLPSGLRVRGLETKWLLKRVADRYLPTGTVRRRKRGLSVPIADWMNGGLRAETDRLLDRGRLSDTGVFDAEQVARILGEHRAGRANHARALWPLVVFERWRERWMGV
ncbi:MAG: asparagine synthase (glutamine-hydrolyzing) [Gemmatimonadales bacterium]|nr:asparagine synthase (glutamine-hydrolyzing) [Gemmatimonadales bacterium]